MLPGISSAGRPAGVVYSRGYLKSRARTTILQGPLCLDTERLSLHGNLLDRGMRGQPLIRNLPFLQYSVCITIIQKLLYFFPDGFDSFDIFFLAVAIHFYFPVAQLIVN